jgi:putative DNA primase/helicase
MHTPLGTNDAAFQAAAIEYRCCDHPSFDVMFAGSIANPFIVGEAAIVLPPLLVDQLELIETAEANGRCAVEDERRRWAEVSHRIGRPMHEKIAEFFGVPWQQGQLMIARFVDEVLGEPPGEGAPASLHSGATAARWVDTDEIKKAVVAREWDVLRALNIPWNGATRGHIHCPYPDHDDRNPSWRWDDQNHVAHCTCSKSDSIFDVVMKKRGVSFDDAKIFVAETIGRLDLIPKGGGGGHQRARKKANGKSEHRIDWSKPEAVFDYQDADGNLIYQNVRYRLLDKDGNYVMSPKGKLDKTFLPRRSDGNGGWINRLRYQDGDPTPGIEMVPYRLPDAIKDMLADRTVPMSFVEGEAKADRLRKLGFAATSIQQGCKGFGEYFDGGNCYILPDNDEAGEERARFVAEGLRGRAESIKRLDLPGLPPGGDILDWIGERLAAGKTEAEISDEYTVLDGTEWVFKPKPVERPVIFCTPGTMHQNASEAESALLAAGVQFYRRGGNIVMPIVEEVDAARGGKTKVARVKEVIADCMKDYLSRVAEFMRWDARSDGFVICNPPAHVAKTILSRDGEWRFAPIAGVITTPILRRDGTILSAPGYDPVTNLLLMSPPPMPMVPENPSEDDARDALDLLDGLLDGFPFVDKASRSVALSGLITPVVRSAMTVAPLHGINAPTPGTGKSYYVELSHGIATGQYPPNLAAGRTEEETEKRLAAAIVVGRGLISVDNLNGELGGDLFCQLVERQVVSIRILGETKLVDVECKATVFVNGNNLTPRADIVRRTIMCGLDANMENPELRTFDRNPLDDIMANRGKYIAAALTIVRAFLAAGKPVTPPSLASYDEWSTLVRAPLMWLGREDPVKTQETARKNDPDAIVFAAVMGELVNLLGPGVEMTAGEIKAAADDKLTQSYSGEIYKRPKLRQVLLDHAGQHGEIDPIKLGRKLGKFNGRVIGNQKLVGEYSTDRKQLVWKITSAR